MPGCGEVWAALAATREPLPGPRGCSMSLYAIHCSPNVSQRIPLNHIPCRHILLADLYRERGEALGCMDWRRLTGFLSRLTKLPFRSTFCVPWQAVKVICSTERLPCPTRLLPTATPSAKKIPAAVKVSTSYKNTRATPLASSVM